MQDEKGIDLADGRYEELLRLKNLLRKDPESYKNEFEIVLNKFYTRENLIYSMTVLDEELLQMINFLSLTVPCYGENVTRTFKKKIVEIMTQLPVVMKMPTELRLAFVKCLMQLRGKDLCSAIEAFEICLPLFRCPDALLRHTLRKFIVADIKRVHTKKKCQSETSAIQYYFASFMIHHHHSNNKINNSSKMATSSASATTTSNRPHHAITAKQVVRLFVELYQRGIWIDDSAANYIGEAVFSSISKVQLTAINFFLGRLTALKNKELGLESDDDDDDDGDDNDATNGDAGGRRAKQRDEQIKKMKLAHRVGKHSRARTHKLDKAIKSLTQQRGSGQSMPGGTAAASKSVREAAARKQFARNKFGSGGRVNTRAMDQIRDSQQFVERLFRILTRSGESSCWEIKSAIMELVSRMIGVLNLQLPGFYSYMQRYLNVKTPDVTNSLLYVAQACHDKVPGDDIAPVLRTIADNFVSEKMSAEAITVGLNSVREICRRCPYAIGRELLSDLIGYRKYRNKNVVAAARSLIRLYREVDRQMLPKGEQGRPTEAQLEQEKSAANGSAAAERGRAVAGGDESIWSTVPGVEALTSSTTTAETATSTNQSEAANSSMRDLASEVIFTDEDFEKMRRFQRKKFETFGKKKRAKKRGAEESAEKLEKEEMEEDSLDEDEDQKRLDMSSDDEEDDDDDDGLHDKASEKRGILSIKSITREVKRAKMSKQERMEAIAAGRADREKFGFKVNRLNPHASTTNAEKRKRKPFGMLLPKFKRRRQNQSLGDQARAKIKHLKNVLRFQGKK